MKHKVTLLMTEFVTHDVKHFVVSKPHNFNYEPGQGTKLIINHPDWMEKARPFTPTSLPDDRVIQFTIKKYPQHAGVTQQLHTLKAGDELFISDPFGTITYHGPGVFIAAGAGITPLIAIIRDLARNNKLADHAVLYSNKTPADIICEKELRHYFNDHCVFTCTRESSDSCDNRRIDEAFLKEHIDNFNQHFYVCGPKAFVKEINASLIKLGANPEVLVFEQ